MRNDSNRARTPAVGYLRVSTNKQLKSGVGLAGQRAAIERFAESEGFEIVDWFQDAASAVGPESIAKRPGVLRAIEASEQRACPIIVNRLDRFARDAATVEQMVFEKKLNVITTDGLLLAPHSLRARAARDEVEGRAIGQRTREALERKKAQGVRLGNRTNLDEAQKKGAAANQQRAIQKVEEIADHLERAPNAESMSAPEIVESLNAVGIRTGRGGVWTVGALRRPLSDARRLIARRREESETLKAIPGFGRFS